VDYFPGVVPFLGGSNIAEFIARTDKWLSPDDPNLKALRVQSGWILVTRSGTTGIVAMVPKAWDGFAMSEHVIRIVPDAEKVDPAYLLAFLRSKYGQEQLARGVFGSVIDEITPEYVGDIEIHLPTSKRKLDEVVELVRKGEEARQRGIEDYVEAVERLNDMLSD
jgi:restriction endonuclease S subunit